MALNFLQELIDSKEIEKNSSVDILPLEFFALENLIKITAA
jgi:hypothetical protein